MFSKYQVINNNKLIKDKGIQDKDSNNIILSDLDNNNNNNNNHKEPIKIEIQNSISIFSIIIIIMVSVLSTLITLIFVHTVFSIPIKSNLNFLTNEIKKLSHFNDFNNNNYNNNNNINDINNYLNYDDYNLKHHDSLLNHLKNDFYTSKGITHDVFIKNIHSHNDYWRNRPLLDALSLGVQSVEADIWYFPENNNNNNTEIFVGHSKNSLKKERQLEILYLDQLYAILEGSNNINIDNNNNNNIHRNYNKTNNYPTSKNHIAGVWDTDSSKTLYFFIDFKTNGDELFDVFSNKLNRFRNNNWLSYYNTTNNEFIWGPITIIGTGNIPLNKVLNQGEIRDIFFDGPLDKLIEKDSLYSIGVSPIASSSLNNLVGGYVTSLNGLTEDQIETALKHIKHAHKLGIKTRIWDTPWWPVSKKYNIWHQIITMGSDYLNADDLVTAASLMV